MKDLLAIAIFYSFVRLELSKLSYSYRFGWAVVEIISDYGIGWILDTKSFARVLSESVLASLIVRISLWRSS